MIEEHESIEPENRVWVQRYQNSSECDVVVKFRGREMSLRCRDYSQAVKWAKIECKAYRLSDDFEILSES
jgi:hypothetical protein